MASPFQVGTTLANNASLGFSPQNRIAILGDGSLLVADNSTATVEDLWQITNPSTATPTITSVTTFTYGGGSTTSLVADLLVIQNGSSAGVDDIWLVLCSDATAGTTIEVVHGTYTQSGGTFAWDTKTSTGVALGAANSQTASIAWNGTNLMVAYRDGASPWVVNLTWTATKNGTGGWQTPFVLNTNANTNSHCNPMLRHDAKLAGGAGGTIALYTRDTGSHSDQWAARVLLDSAASPASANWKAEVLGGPTGQNVGTALQSVCVDPANGNVHLVWNTSVAGSGAIGDQYMPITVNSSGTPSFGTRLAITTTSGNSLAVCVDALSRVYCFFSTAAVGSNSVINYKTSDSPYTSLSAQNTTVFATAANGSNVPHVPSHDQAVSGYVPLLVQNGKTSGWTAQFDNTVNAQQPPVTSFPFSGPRAMDQSRMWGAWTYRRRQSDIVATFAQQAPPTNPDPTGALQDYRNSLRLYRVTRRGRTLEPPWGQASAPAVPIFIDNPRRSRRPVGTPRRAGIRLWQLAVQLGIQFWEYTEQGLSGSPAGHNSPQDARALRWIDRSGNGHDWVIIPGYGGALISRR
ncbi:MAG TPA: hypothetical protein VNG04_08030, partial [Candidatus Acidoferrum sp.]|nr:hypothetical protein [Candidatus Acidoferrum sp.]